MARYPGAKWLPVRNHSGALAANLGLILHVQVGTGTLSHYFDTASVRASSHFWAAKSGAVEQYVDTGLRAWAQSAGNATYCSVETEGQPGEPLTAAQVASLADLYRWGHSVHGWPYQLAEAPGQSGFGWHGMGGSSWGGHFGCPGDLRKAQRPQILALAQGEQGDDDMTPEQEKQLTLVAQMAPTQYVYDLYRIYGRRDPDPAGFEFWVGQVTATNPLAVFLGLRKALEAEVAAKKAKTTAAAKPAAKGK